MANECKLNDEALKDREAGALSMALYDLWDNRFEDSEIQLPEQFLQYPTKTAHIQLILELLFQDGKIQHPTLFDDRGRMNPHATGEEISQLFSSSQSPGILHGLRVGVIGGIEGEIFAALGANAVSIDPAIENLPHHNRNNLQEIPETLTSLLAAAYPQAFDLTLTSRLFDRGSGLDQVLRFGFAGISDAEKLLYSQYIEMILSMTKSGGISVHDGNMVQYGLGNIQTEVELIGAFPQFSFDRIGSSPTIFALRKL